MENGRNQSTSLRRGLALLAALGAATESGVSPTLTELAAQTGLNRSTASRLLQPLIESRCADYDQETGRYRLGPHTARLGQIYLDHLDLHDLAVPVMRVLVEECRETAHLGIRDRTDIVYVEKFESRLSVRTVSRVGTRQPLYCTAMGKMVLAHSDPELLDDVVAHGMPAHTPNTLTSRSALSAELDAIRERGYAVDDQENEAEIRCVAGPVFDHSGQVAAALSISGPATRMPMERLPELAVLVGEAAAEISRRLAAPESAITGDT